MSLSVPRLPWDSITPELEAEETANDSDKTISVPTGEEWKILWIRVELSTTATVGNRQIVVNFRDDADDIIFGLICPTNIAPSASGRFNITPELNTLASGVWKTTPPIPKESLLNAGYDIRIYDVNAVDAAADDMDIQMEVKKRKV